MTKKHLIIVFATLFVFPFAVKIEAQQKWHFATSKKVLYSKTVDESLDRAIKKWNAPNKSDDLHYHFNKVDLNSDGKLDAIVFVSGSSICGTGGCEMLIFNGDGENFTLLTEMSVSRPPIFVAVTKTKGWNDLLMEVSGGGIKPYFAVLKFDGKSYPENPTVEPSLPKKSRAKFVEYLSEIEDYYKGFEVK